MLMIRSANPHLSYLLRKNPNGAGRVVQRDNCVGWYDGDTWLASTDFAFSPLDYLRLIKLFLRDSYKKPLAQDNQPAEIRISPLLMGDHKLPVVGGEWNPMVVRGDTLALTISQTIVTLAAVAAATGEARGIGDTWGQALIEVIEPLTISLPYPIVAAIKPYARKYVSQLTNNGWKLSPHNSQRSRIEFVKQHAIGRILDYGCGEGDYAKLPNYVGYDPALETRTIDKYPQSVFCFTEPDGDFDTVLLCEVIEHTSNPQLLVRHILQKYRPTKLIITTPNYSFNQHLGLVGFRHNDHQFEFTSEQFEKFLEPFPHTRYNIGDEKDGVSLTQAAIIEVQK